MTEGSLPSISALELSEILRNYGLLVSAVLTVFIAWQGLSSWKKQKIWEDNRALAKTLVKQSYQIREFFQKIRSINLRDKHRAKQASKLLSEFNVRGLDPALRYHCDSSYYLTLREQFEELKKETNVKLFEAEAVWSKEIVLPIHSAINQAEKVFENFAKYLLLLGGIEDGTDIDKAIDLLNSEARVFNSEMDDADIRMTDTIRGVEEVMAKFLGRPS